MAARDLPELSYDALVKIEQIITAPLLEDDEKLELIEAEVRRVMDGASNDRK